MIGLGSGISNVEEFNRRADIALRGVTFGYVSSADRVVQEFKRQLAAGAVSEKMQQAIYNIVHRYRRQITDRLVTDYAAPRARGSE